MATAAAHQADRKRVSSVSPRRSGSPPSLPLLNWETERAITLLEARRLELQRRIARLKPRSHARIVLEAELRALTLQALRAETPAPGGAS